jgi:hypothetical protein
MDFDLPEPVAEERVVERPRQKLASDPCQRCSHARSDHSDGTQKKNREPYCEMPICSCLWFVEFGEIPVSSFSRAWIKENGLLQL